MTTMSNSIVDKVSVWILIFVAGWIACSGYYQIPKLWANKNLVPVLADVAGCQTARANIATDQLNHSLSDGAVDFDKTINCPKPPPVKAILSAPKK